MLHNSYNLPDLSSIKLTWPFLEDDFSNVIGDTILTDASFYTIKKLDLEEAFSSITLTDGLSGVAVLPGLSVFARLGADL